ncbi:MAG: hypothetical protein ACJAX5_000469 [Patiriisocius sp.]|jgi:hypothetical protein
MECKTSSLDGGKSEKFKGDKKALELELNSGASFSKEVSTEGLPASDFF